jgi:hypothetical protein
LEPELFLKLIAEGDIEVGPTDKNYKVYVTATPGSTVSVPNGHAKFYFQHFDKDQRIRFIDLYNSKVMKLGYPGYFYVAPYFMRMLAPSESPAAAA